MSSPELPLYLGRRPSAPSPSPSLQDDSRQSFPATVRERDSTWTIQTKRESIRGPPPPLPPKPMAWSSVVHPPVMQRGKSTSDLTTMADLAEQDGAPTTAEDGSDSPKSQGSPSQWLDIMFGHSEPQVAPPLSRTNSNSAANPFPSAPRLPPRPSTSTSPSPAPVTQRAPSPAIQISTSPSLPSLASIPPALPPRPDSAGQAQPGPSSSAPARASASTSQPATTSHSYSSSPSSSYTFNTLGQGIQHLKLKDRFAAGVGFGREWGGKGKGKLQEGWRVGSAAVGRSSSAGSNPGAADRTTLGSSPVDDGGFAQTQAARARSTSPLPATILGHRLPKNPPHVAFGLPLPAVLEATKVEDLGHRKRDEDPVTGDESRRWLPSVAFRCLQYLEEWGKSEEGIYRVPGRSNLVAQLRALFDAGIDLDLREIHPGDLDPHAVASLFKSWLREIPESLLSPALDAEIEKLSQDELGYSASVSQFLAQRQSGAPGATGVSGAGAVAGMVDGRAPRAFLERLREVFADQMDAEYFYLLRALAYHLARLASHSGANKMTLSNLRLILSPTLRLSPIFLQILVEEREILFGKLNESARHRESADSAPPRSPGLASVHSSPSLSNYAGGQASSRQSPLLNPPSPRFDTTSSSSPSPTHSTARFPSGRRGSNSDYHRAQAGNSEGLGAEWLIVDEPGSLEALSGSSSTSSAVLVGGPVGVGAGGASERRPSSPSFPISPSLHSSTPSAPTTPASPDFPSRATRTPIADRFVSTFTGPASSPNGSRGSGSSVSPSIDSPPPSAGLSPLAAHFPPPSTSPKLGGGPPAPPPKPFIPSRQPAGQAASHPGGFFGNRSPVLGSSGGGVASRKGSDTSLGAGSATKETSSAPVDPPRSSSEGSLSTSSGAMGRRGAVTAVEGETSEELLRGLGVLVGGTEGEQEQLADVVAMGEKAGATRRASVERLTRGRQWSDDTESSETRGSFEVGRRASRSLSLGEGTGGRPSVEAIRPSMESARSFASSSTRSSAAAPPPRAPIALPSLTLPSGLGLGLGAPTGAGKGIGEEEDSWGLLSVAERKRFFGGA